MRKLYLAIAAILLLAAIPVSLTAQVSSYQFNAVSGTYTPLVGGVDVDIIEADDTYSSSISLPFTFTFNGTGYTSVIVSSNGWMSFNPSVTNSTTGNNLSTSATSIRPLLAPLWDDLDGRSTNSSQASYLTSGSAPNRVFTMEWFNWEWNYGSSASPISFQVKLYETTNVVEFIYQQGPGSVNSGSASIGIAGASTGAGNYLSLNNTSTNPTASSTSETTTINTRPANGQVYRFSPATCFQPTALTASATSGTSASLGWAAPATTGADYIWRVVATGTGINGTILDQGTTTGLTATTSALTAITTYQLYVANNCGASDTSNWAGPVSFTTPCASFTPAYNQNFASYIPTCWNEAAGTLAATTTFTSTTASSWAADGFGNVGSTGAARINIYGTTSSDNEWLISPTIDLGAGATSYQLEFDLALTAYGATSSTTLGSDDIFAVVISTDNGVTWSNTNILRQWGSTDVISNTGDHITLDLTTYTGEVKLGFYASSTVGNVDVDLFIDNFLVVEIPACVQPTAFTATATTATTADLTWGAPASGPTPASYNYLIVASGAGTSGTAVASGNTGSLSATVSTGLAAETSYDAYVRSVCGPGDTSTYTAAVNFTTPCAALTPAVLEAFGSYVPSCWTETQGTLAPSITLTGTSSNWKADGFGNVGSTGAVSINIYGTTASASEWLISPSIDLGTGATPYQMEFDLALTTYAGTSSTTFGSDDIFAVVISTDNGVTWTNANVLRQWGSTDVISNTGDHIIIDLSSYTGLVQIGFYASSTVYNVDVDLHIDNFEVDVIPACAEPSSPTVAVTSATDVALSWTVPVSGPPTNYEYEIVPSGTAAGSGGSVVSGTVSGATTSTTETYAFTTSQAYELYVRSDCSGSPSPWSTAATFTILPGDNCALIEDLGSMTSPFSGTTVGYTIGDIAVSGCTDINSSPSRIFKIDVPNGTRLEMGQVTNNYDSYHTANYGGTCPGTTSIVCIDNDYTYVNWDNTTGSTQTVYWTQAGWSTSSGTFTLEWEIITCLDPSGLSSTVNSGTEADFSWTASASSPSNYEWLVVLDGAGTNGTPVDGGVVAGLLSSTTALSPATDYDLYVRGICAVGDSSAWVGPHSLVTPCSFYTPAYQHNFTSFPGTCWSETSGTLAASTTLSGTTANWQADGFGNSGSTGAARINIYGTSSSDNEWLLSPSIDLGAGGTSYQMEFDLALTAYGSTSTATLGADDIFAVVISTDNGVTWSNTNILRQWGSADAISNTGDHIVIDLSGYTGLVQLGFYASSTVNNVDVDLFVDNFEVREIPQCFAPASLTATATSGTTADLSWTAPASGPAPASYNYLVVASGAGVTGTAVATGNTAGLTASPATLAAQTSYDAYVRAVCGPGDSSIFTGPISFTTPCAALTPAVLEAFGTYVPACWSEATGALAPSITLTGTSSNWKADGFGNVGSSGAVSINVYGSSASTEEWLISPSIDLGTGATPYQMEFDLALTTYAGTSSTTFGSDDIFAVVISTDNGATWSNANVLRQWGSADVISNTGDHITIDLSSYTGVVQLGFYASSTVYNVDVDLHIDNFKVDVIPACGAPTTPSATVTSVSTVDLLWTQPLSGAPTNYDYEIVPSGTAPGTGGSVVNATVSGVTTSASASFAFTAGQDYEFYVRADCSGSPSSWSVAATFKVLPGDICATAEDLGALSSPVSATTTGYTAGDITVSGCAGINGSPSRIYYIDVPAGAELTIGQTTNNFDSYHAVAYGATCPGTTSLTCLDSDLNQTVWLNATGSTQRVYWVESGYSTYSSGNFTLAWNLITCNPPVNFAATPTSATDASLSWTAAAGSPDYEWLIVASGAGLSGTQVDAGVTSSTTDATTALAANTTYDAYSRTICGVGDTSTWSSAVSFTTPCLAFTPAYTEAFTSYPPTCWRETEGTLAASSTLAGTTSNWQADGFGNVGSGGSARINIVGTTTSDKDWLISPSIDLGTGTPYQLEFDIALTTSGSAGSNTLGTDDLVAVVISTDNGVTWSNANILQQWTSASTISNTGDHIIIDLSTYTGTVQIGFYASSTVTNQNVDLFIDNFKVDIIPSCGVPLSPSAVISSLTQVDFSWSAPISGTVSSYDWEVVLTGNTPGTGVAVESGNTATTSASSTSLSINQSYSFYVRANCTSTTGGWSIGQVFNILPGDYCTIAQDLNTLSSPFSGTTVGYTAGDITAAGCTGINSSPSRIFFIDVPNGAKLTIGQTTNSYDSYHSVRYGGSCAGTTSLACTDTDLSQTVWTNTTGSSQTVYWIQAGWSTYSGAFTLAWELETCVAPASLTASGATINGVDLNWPSSSAGNYEWKVVATGAGSSATAIDGGYTTGLTASASGLSSSSTYDAYVRGICAPGDTSIWEGPEVFATTCASITTLPWVEDLESMSSTGTGVVPSCWAESGDWVSSSTSTSYNRGANSGSNYVYTNYGADDWLMTPGFDLVPNQDYVFSFYYITDGLGGWQNIEVGVGSGQTPASFTTIVGTPLTNVSNTSYQQYQVVFSVPTAGTYNLGLHVESNYTPWYMSFDDFYLSDTCVNYRWTGIAGNGQWNDAANWSCNTVPTATDNVIIPGGVVTYPNDYGVSTIIPTADLTIESGGLVTMVVGADFAVNGDLNILSGGTIDELVISGSSPNISVKGNLNAYGTFINTLGTLTLDGATGQTVTGSMDFTNVELDNTSGATISTGSTIGIAGVLSLRNGTLNANGGLKIRSTASRTGVINDFEAGMNGSVTGSVAVERYVAADAGKFFYTGSAVSGATIADWGADFAITATNGGNGSQVIPFGNCDPLNLNSSSPYGTLFDYRENTVSTCNLQGWHVRTTGSIPNGMGFIANVPNGTTIDLNGAANTGAISTSALTLTGGNTTPAQGFNLISNPYPSPIDWLTVAAANSSDIAGTAYMYQSSGPLVGTYVAVNSVSIGSKIIGSSQAMFVDALSNGATVSFDNSMRVVGDNNVLRTSGPSVSLDITIDGNGFKDKSLIVFDNNFTDGFDLAYDAQKLNSNSNQPTIFTVESGENRAINALPSPSSVQVIPLNLIPGADGTFDFTFDNTQSFDASALIFLEDLNTGTIQNLMENNVYSFMALQTDDESRFLLHFVPAADITLTDATCDQTDGNIAIDLGTFNVGNTTVIWDEVKVVNAQGVAVYTQQQVSGVANANGLTEGTYTVLYTYGSYSNQETLVIEAPTAVNAAFQTNSSSVNLGETVVFANQSTTGATYTWNFGDGTTSTLENPVHSYTEAGTYTVTLIVDNGICSSTSTTTMKVEGTTGIADVNATPTVTIYSNKSIIYIQFNNLPAGTFNMEVYDLVGRQITEKQTLDASVTAHQQKIEDIVPGFYFVKLYSGSTVHTKKVFLGDLR